MLGIRRVVWRMQQRTPLVSMTAACSPRALCILRASPMVAAAVGRPHG